MACISSVILAQILDLLNFDTKDFVDDVNGAVKDELLSILFELFGVK